MQYPQIQFYRGSLVRLASGRLKQVEELSSEDFLESARLVAHTPLSSPIRHSPVGSSSSSCSPLGSTNNHRASSQLRPNSLEDNNNNNSVFNSPERAHSDSPTPMDISDDLRPAQRVQDQGRVQDEDEDDDDEELDVVSPIEPEMKLKPSQEPNPIPDQVHVDLSVVRDFLEVGPPGSASPKMSNRSQSDRSTIQPNVTVLIKFFLEASRGVVFIEVPVEHPFFVFHRGWSSWNPQRTYDKFGLKCRKLKIGDTCISLIRRQRKPSTQPPSTCSHSALQDTSSSPSNSPFGKPPNTNEQTSHMLRRQLDQHSLLQPHKTSQFQHRRQQQESDHCNIMFSSIKINE